MKAKNTLFYESNSEVPGADRLLPSKNREESPKRLIGLDQFLSAFATSLKANRID